MVAEGETVKAVNTLMYLQTAISGTTTWQEDIRTFLTYVKSTFYCDLADSLLEQQSQLKVSSQECCLFLPSCDAYQRPRAINSTQQTNSNTK